MPNDPATDQAALLALQQGDAGALNRLIARWQRPLHSFAYRYCQNAADAEDLVAKVSAFVRNNPEVQVMVAGDRRTDFGTVYQGMVLLQQAGVSKVGLMSKPEAN